ncbi:MAG: outer membrane protein assembly factor [Bacteroidales bacterium]|jgi:outer membrane protein assembly factor BamA|nr:outer membrane protein assembly factor [Bacteroidales bacterium]
MKGKILAGIILFCYLFFNKTSEVFSQEVSEPKATVKEKKDSYWRRLIFGHIDRTHDRKFDGTFIVAPSYTREASVGIGGMATGLYRIDRTDSIMPPSNISLTGNVSIRGFYSVAFNGNNYFKGNRSRLSYEASFSSKPLNFWGISYEACTENPMTKYTRQQIKVNVVYPYEIINNFYVGAVLNFTHTRIIKITDLSYLEGQKLANTFAGAGLSVQYDSRDFILNPKRGVNLMFQEIIFPKWTGNAGKTLFRSTVIVNYYQKLWKGSILAIDVYGEFNYHDVPWAMKEELGNSYRMRGYYAGRYIDNHIAVCQLEVRQNIYKRFGCAAWVGTGTVFPSFDELRFSNLLITYGLGLRLEFKHNVNLRIDYGFGKKTNGFVLNIGEAF